MVLAVFMGGLGLGSHLAVAAPRAAPLAGLRARGGRHRRHRAAHAAPAARRCPRAYAAVAVRAGLGAAAEATRPRRARHADPAAHDRAPGGDGAARGRVPQRAGGDLRKSLGRTYLANTLGAAAGVFLGTFVLVPHFGVSASLALCAALNLLAGGVAWRWSRELSAAEASAAARRSRPAETPWMFGALAAVSGAFTFGIEVLWTRSFTLVIGSTVYAFSVMLLAVLVGLAAGTALYARLRSRVARPDVALGGRVRRHRTGRDRGRCLADRPPARRVPGPDDRPADHVRRPPGRPRLRCAWSRCLPVTGVLGFSFPLLRAPGRARRVRAGSLGAPLRLEHARARSWAPSPPTSS